MTGRVVGGLVWRRRPGRVWVAVTPNGREYVITAILNYRTGRTVGFVVDEIIGRTTHHITQTRALSSAQTYAAHHATMEDAG